jgi:YD repeat-containing protein
MAIVLLGLLGAGVSAALAGVTYRYDRLHRLVEADYGNGKKVVYEYDAVGNRTTRVSTCTYCPGDVNGDGFLDINDVNVFVAVLLGTDTNPAHLAAADMDRNGVADGNDIQLFVNALLLP